MRGTRIARTCRSSRLIAWTMTMSNSAYQAAGPPSRAGVGAGPVKARTPVRGWRRAFCLSSLVHRLGDETGFDAFRPILRTVTGPADATERRIGAADHVGVDPDHPRLDLTGEDLLAPGILGPGVGGKAVGQPVGLLDHLALASEGIED